MHFLAEDGRSVWLRDPLDLRTVIRIAGGAFREFAAGESEFDEFGGGAEAAAAEAYGVGIAVQPAAATSSPASVRGVGRAVSRPSLASEEACVLDQITAPQFRVDVPSAMAMSVTATAEATTVAVRGEIDLPVLDRLRNRLGEEIDLTPRALVLDLSQVSFCGAGGITELLVAASEAHVSGVPFAVAAAGRAVRRPIRALGLERSLPVHGSVAAALEWLAVLPRLRESGRGPA